MIDTIIFDFGNVFIDIDRKATEKAFAELGIKEWTEDLELSNQLYELGKIDELEFMSVIQKHIPETDILSIRNAWNIQVGDFPLKRLEFLQLISNKYRILLLSNADRTHIDKFEHKFGVSFARDFYSCFEKVYFSFEFGFRKPDVKAFQLIINNHNITPKTTLFIDDTLEHIKSASSLGINTWHLNPEKEDVTQLLDKLKTAYA
ncbi:HAD family phosphatase [Flavobacterium sp.]|jgi:putative hydrolase of the HAD superfamily|uniref:HAD family hydrolase n=1 Tax=Flavobacterium sp. TaxID=239 RepID=UPI002A802F74|nr:HAD family phosphatase [Flavobacterium sp.]